MWRGARQGHALEVACRPPQKTRRDAAELSAAVEAGISSKLISTPARAQHIFGVDVSPNGSPGIIPSILMKIDVMSGLRLQRIFGVDVSPNGSPLLGAESGRSLQSSPRSAFTAVASLQVRI